MTASQPSPTSHQPRSRLALSWLIAFALAAVAVAMALRGGGFDSGLASWLLALLPWFYLALPITLAVSLVTRRWIHAVASAALMAVAVVWLAPLYTPNSPALADAPGAAAPDAVGSGEIRVATLNLKFGQGDVDQVIALVKSENLDILALQELPAKTARELDAAGLAELMPYRIESKLNTSSGANGTALYSRTPLSEETKVDGYVHGVVTATVTLGGESSTVIVAHPVSPRLPDTSDWSGELRSLAALSEGFDGPVMVLGDLNSTWDHASFRALLEAGLVDAADQAGAGYVPTFPSQFLPLPVTAIDHVLTRDVDFVAREYRSFTIEGTDHRGLVVVFDR